MTVSIPDRERGYSIEPDTGTVHERYQTHVPIAMRTSAKGVSAYLKGREPVPCLTCFPVKPKRISVSDGGEVTPLSIRREDFGLPPRESQETKSE